MKIIHVEDFFHANAGYQINILAKYMAHLGHEIIIITSKMDKIPAHLTEFFGRDNIEESDASYTKQYGVKIIRLPIYGYISGRSLYHTSQLDRIILKENPDILYIHGNDTVTGIRYAKKQSGLPFPIIMDSHMLEMASENKLNKLYRIFYKKFVTPQLIKYQTKIIRTQNDPYVESVLGIPLAQAPWISTGSDLMLFHPDEIERKRMREKYDIGNNDFVVIYTGKLIESKGGLVLAEAFKENFDTDRNVILLVVGNTSGVYGQEVEKVFAESEYRVIRMPTQPYVELAKYYQMADLSVFPKQVSLSFYDAQACGLPVVSESNNINDERVSHNNGLTYEVNNLNDFRRKIQFFINLDKKDWIQYSINAHSFVKSNYNYGEIVNDYLSIINQEIERHMRNR